MFLALGILPLYLNTLSVIKVAVIIPPIPAQIATATGKKFESVNSKEPIDI
jgi:hypothetical protein